jgi:hypothetical protein
MVAVKVTSCPQTEGLVAEVRVVVEIVSAWPTIPPENSDSAPAVSPAAILPFTTQRPAQTTRSAVELWLVRCAAAGAKQRVNSRKAASRLRAGAARSGGSCGSLLIVASI